MLYSSATDGHISIWDLRPLLLDYRVRREDLGPDLGWVQGCPSRLKVHQSGINAMAVRKSPSPGCHLLLSAGDDNALAVTCLKMSGDGGGSCTASVLWQLVEPAAHCSAVTGRLLCPLCAFLVWVFK